MITEGRNTVRLTEEDMCRSALNIARVAGMGRGLAHPPRIKWWHRWLGVLPAEIVVEVFEMRE